MATTFKDTIPQEAQIAYRNLLSFDNIDNTAHRCGGVIRLWDGDFRILRVRLFSQGDTVAWVTIDRIGASIDVFGKLFEDSEHRTILADQEITDPEENERWLELFRIYFRDFEN